MKKISKYVETHPMTILLYVVYTLALIGIACAIIGHYGLHGFDWRWFVFFEGPMYAFCGWALFKTLKVANQIMTSEDESARKNGADKSCSKAPKEGL